MKKIGILTFHRSINYGAYMQCLSLSHYLAKRFPQAQIEVIDYESKFMREHYVPRCSLSYIRHPLIFRDKKKQYRSFQKALQYLPLSEQYFAFDGQSALFSRYVQDRYDVVVIGSDAVFNWIKRGFPNPYVCPPGKKKLSYAASAYGMAEEQTRPEDLQTFGAALAEFSYIGVRDDYTQTLVKKVHPGAAPAFTCDPTVLLDLDYVLECLGHTKESYREYIYTKYKLPRDKKLIGVMEIDPCAMQMIRKRLGTEYCFVGFYSHTKGVDRHIADVNPLEWSLLFGLFEFTITNYFHGTLLSLRNHTPVLSFDRTAFSRTNEGKIHDVMRRMDLLDCCFVGKYDPEVMLAQAESIVKDRAAYQQKIRTNLNKLQESAGDFTQALQNVLEGL